MHWFPKTKIGRTSFYGALASFVLMYLQYWIAMLFQTSIPPWIGLIPLVCLCAAGVASIVSLVKYKEKAILIYVSSVIGCLGFVMILGELVLPH